MKPEETIRLALEESRLKLNLYRQQHTGSYIGGVEFTRLVALIDEALAINNAGGEAAQPVAYVVRSKSDDSIFGDEVAPVGWSTFDKRMEGLRDHPWIKVGAAEIVPLYDIQFSAGWIPMKERQPADFERVLCINGAGYMTTANRFHRAGGSLEDWNGSDYTAEEAIELVIGGITHWMPLPKPPIASPQNAS